MYRQRARYRKRKRISKLYYYIAGGVLLIVLGVIAFLFLFPAKSVEENFSEQPFTSSEQFSVLTPGAAYISRDRYSLVDFRAQPQWENLLFSTDMKISASDKLYAAYNPDMLQTVDVTGKLLYSKKPNGKILNVSCGATRVAYFCEQKDANGMSIFVLNIIDASGNDMAEINFNNQNVVDFGFYGKNEMLWVLSIDVSGVIPVSRITTYGQGKYNMTGLKDISNQLVEKVVIDEENIYACGTTHINVFTLFGEAVDSILIYGWKYNYHTTINGKPLFIYIPRNDSDKPSFRAIRIVRTDKAATSLNLPEDCEKVTVHNNKIYCVSKKNIYIYSLDAVYLDTIELPYPFDSVKDAAEGFAFFAKGVQVLSLPLK